MQADEFFVVPEGDFIRGINLLDFLERFFVDEFAIAVEKFEGIPFGAVMTGSDANAGSARLLMI